MPRTPRTRHVVLVIGDSFVDENWLVSPFDVYHAYNVGHDHFLSNLPDADSRVLSLCGAASVWRILNGQPVKRAGFPQRLNSRYGLLGMSAWNPRDDVTWPCLLCAKGDETKWANPYLLTGLPGPGASGRCPHTQDPCADRPQFLNRVSPTREAEVHTSTNKIIRVYTGFGGDQPTLENRYDCRLDLAREYKKSGREAVAEIERRLGDASLKAIVVVDHGYGVMDEELVAELLNRFPRAGWYVRCKLDTVPWLRLLSTSGADIRLAFTDEQLMTYEYGTRTWMRGSSVVGRGALETLGDLLGLPTYQNTLVMRLEDRANVLGAKNAALLLNADTAVAASRGTDGAPLDATIKIIARPPGPYQSIRVGRSTVFFTSLVYWDLMDREGLCPDTIDVATTWALRNEYDWTRACTRAWLRASANQLSGPFDTAIYSTPIPQSAAAGGLLKYAREWSLWNDSSKDLGVIEVGRGTAVGAAASGDSERQIQIWRAQGAVGDYICPGGQKRDQINNLVRCLGVYQASRSKSYPFNCLFIGEPGWGKSRLARSLAQKFDLEYVGLSIAGMASNRDLMEALRAVSSLQNEIGRSLLIFIDEIDAEIEGHAAMGLLLGPMWDGTFKTEGIAYGIQHCVWVFASTKPIARLMQESKGRDFLARVNGPVIELDFFRSAQRERIHREREEDDRIAVMLEIAMQDGNESLRTEMVYHGVNCLNSLFGPISAVDEGVLQVFYDAFPINGVRSLQIFVSRFRNVSGGRVSVENVPSLDDYAELKRHIRKLAQWPEKNTGRDIKVVVNPPD